MQDFAVGLLDLGVDGLDLGLHLGRGGGGHGDELDQVLGLAEKILDQGDVMNIVAAQVGGDGQFARLLDQGAGAQDAFGGGDEFGHGVRIPISSNTTKEMFFHARISGQSHQHWKQQETRLKGEKMNVHNRHSIKKASGCTPHKNVLAQNAPQRAENADVSEHLSTMRLPCVGFPFQPGNEMLYYLHG